MSLLKFASDAIDRWRTMRELRVLNKADRDGGYWTFKNLMFEALDVFDRDQRRRAIELWESAYAMFPDEALESDLALKLLFNLKLYDVIETLMSRGRKKYPGRPRFLENLAQVAYERGDVEEALQRARMLRKESPGSLPGYLIAAGALGALGKAKEAEAIMVAGLNASPDDVHLRIGYAKLAERRQDYAEALQRWTHVHEIIGHVVGTVGVAASLTKLGRYGEAEAIINDNLYRHSAHMLIWHQLARISEEKGDWEEAATRWGIVRKRFPLQPFGYMLSLQAFGKLGQRAEAEAVMLEGMDRLPDDPACFLEYALLAHRAGDFVSASPRWAAFRDRFPDRPEGYRFGAEAVAALGLSKEADKLRSHRPG